MAPHSSTLAWKIPWMEEPGRLQSMGSTVESQTWLSDFTLTFHFHALEKEMATHSSVLAWRIPGTGEPAGLPCMGSQSQTWLMRLSSSSNPKGNQPWIFTGRAYAEVEAPILWSPEWKNQLIRKDADAGKEWRQQEKGVTEDELVGWHHWLNGHEFEQTLGDSEGQGSLVFMG